MRREFALLVLCFALATPAQSREAPSIPGIDAPELARLGESAVGVGTLELADETRGGRRLAIDLWYPAIVADGATPESYRGSLTAEPPAPPTPFTRPGIAVRDAKRQASRERSIQALSVSETAHSFASGTVGDRAHPVMTIVAVARARARTFSLTGANG